MGHEWKTPASVKNVWVKSCYLCSKETNTSCLKLSRFFTFVWGEESLHGSVIPLATVLLPASQARGPAPNLFLQPLFLAPSPAAPVLHTSTVPSSALWPPFFRAAHERCSGGERWEGVQNASERDVRPKKPGRCCALLGISSWITLYILWSCLHSCDAQGKMRGLYFTWRKPPTWEKH